MEQVISERAVIIGSELQLPLVLMLRLTFSLAVDMDGVVYRGSRLLPGVREVCTSPFFCTVVCAVLHFLHPQKRTSLIPGKLEAYTV